MAGLGRGGRAAGAGEREEAEEEREGAESDASERGGHSLLKGVDVRGGIVAWGVLAFPLRDRSGREAGRRPILRRFVCRFLLRTGTRRPCRGRARSSPGRASSATTAIAFQSRQASLIGRREVFTGKAKFGIFGDGKEVAQVALARAFRPGDFRSGYYRDQTLMMALGLLTVEQFFAQLYADADIGREPCSAGRSMTAHFSTCLLNPDGSFRDLVDLLNSSSDVSPTGSQMPRLVGLAYASRLYRELPELREMARRSRRTATRSPSAPSATPAAPRGCSGRRSTPSACSARRR